MALKDLSIPTASGDLVAIIGQEFGQVFSLARPMESNVGLTKKVMKHPVEDGTEITDHQIIEPVQIELAVFIGGLDPRSVFQQLKQSFINGDLFTVQGKTETYESMLLSAMPYKEGVEMFGSIIVLLRFEEVKFAQAQFGTLPPQKVANPANSDTVQRGNQQTEEVTRPSLLFSAGESVSDFFKGGRDATDTP